MRNEKRSSEDFRGIMKLATGLKLTFYGASYYLYLAKSKGLTLVTEDDELRERARKQVNLSLGMVKDT